MLCCVLCVACAAAFCLMLCRTYFSLYRLLHLVGYVFTACLHIEFGSTSVRFSFRFWRARCIDSASIVFCFLRVVDFACLLFGQIVALSSTFKHCCCCCFSLFDCIRDAGFVCVSCPYMFEFTYLLVVSLI